MALLGVVWSVGFVVGVDTVAVPVPAAGAGIVAGAEVGVEAGADAEVGVEFELVAAVEVEAGTAVAGQDQLVFLQKGS